jgi:hypothetical protein
MYFRDLDGDQARTYIDTEQAYGAYREACDHERAFAGTMHWKTVNGHEYLYRRFTNRAESLGPRNCETEARLQEFTAGKAAAAERVTGLAGRLRVQGRLARALGIGRVPRVAARVLEAVNAEPDLRNQVTVVGTHALWAYETMAAVQFESEVVATRDVDNMVDAGAQMELMGPLAGGGLLGFLQSVDRSFRRHNKLRFRAINAEGYAVDLLAPDRRFQEPRLVRSDLTPQRIEALNELADADVIERVVIGELGHVITAMRVPDPRAFVRHKLWLSERTDRGTKRRRDGMMAEAVAKLIVEHLPQYPLAPADIVGFPEEVRLSFEMTPRSF